MDPNVGYPKLRRSIVTRAVQNIVSSTPFMKTPNHFINDGLNISPISNVENERREEESRNTPIILTSENNTASHFVPISQSQDKGKILTGNQLVTEEAAYNKKRTDVVKIQATGKS